MLEWILRYWIELAFGLLVSCFGVMIKVVHSWLKRQKMIEKGVLSMLHDRLYQACQYYLGRGEIDLAGLKNVESLYNAYHALGGNGTGTELYERVKDLPLKNEK